MSTAPLSIAEFAGKIKAKDERLKSFSDEQLAAGVLKRRPDLIRFMQSSPSKPQVRGLPDQLIPKELQPSTFSERIGERIQQNIYAIPDVIDKATGAARKDLKSEKAKAEYDKGIKEEAEGTKKMVFGDATTTFRKTVNAAWIGPRTAYSMAKGYAKDPATLIGDVVTAVPALAERIPADKVAVDPVGKVSAIGGRTRAGALFNKVEGAIGDAPVPHEPLMDKINAVQELSRKGFTPPKVVNDLAKWIQEHSQTSIQGGIDTPGSSMPATFKDMRDFYSSFNESIDWRAVEGGKGGKMGRAVMALRNELGSQLMATASRLGYGREYASALANYHKALKLESRMGPLGKVVGKITGYASPTPHPFIAGQVGGKVGESVGEGLGRKITGAQ